MMLMKKYLVLTLALIAGFAWAEKITARGNAGSELSACDSAKKDAERQARNAKSTVESYGSCRCEKAASGVDCYMDARIEKKR